MSAIHIGTNVRRVSQQLAYDPQRGRTLVEEYRGHPNACQSLHNGFASAGLHSEYSEAQGTASVRVTYADNNDGQTTETPTDHYEVSKDYVQESIWRSVFVWQQAGSSADTVASWRNSCEAALRGTDDGGPQTPTETGFTSTLLEIYKHLLIREDTFDAERVVLSRVRTFSIRYAARTTLDADPKVYTTASLISTFNIPTAIQSLLPSTPSYVPAGFAWGWKRRQDRTQYTYGGRVEETMDWVFAPWSQLLHNFV